MSTAIGLEESVSTDGEIRLQSVGPGFEMPVFVIFTSMNRTRKALEKASQLGKPFKRGIEILVMQIVPFFLPLDEPPVPFEFIVRRLEEMADDVTERTRISAYLCRDLLESLKRILNRNCPVVMGIRKSWWPTRDMRLSRKLRHAGYNVILVETE